MFGLSADLGVGTTADANTRERTPLRLAHSRWWLTFPAFIVDVSLSGGSATSTTSDYFDIGVTLFYAIPCLAPRVMHVCLQVSLKLRIYIYIFFYHFLCKYAFRKWPGWTEICTCRSCWTAWRYSILAPKINRMALREAVRPNVLLADR